MIRSKPERSSAEGGKRSPATCSWMKRSIGLWEIIHETIQLFGGRAYFTDRPYERMMRDARINLIGEGANGCRSPGGRRSAGPFRSEHRRDYCVPRPGADNLLLP